METLIYNMKYCETEIKGAYIIEPEKKEDERGFFARSWDIKEFEEKNLNPKLVQCSISYNHTKGTLRGLHYQIKPYQEIKYVRCTRGKVFEVLVDLRPNSHTFKKWISVELSAQNYRMIYAPEGCALGFQTLENETELFYQMSEFYSPGYERGLRYDDPILDIKWPLAISIISKRDLSFPYLDDTIEELLTRN